MTIKDIAKLSGVSVTTVSRVLNNHPDVSRENREKVLAVIKQTNFIPNNSARSLVKTTSDNIGVLVRGISNPFYTDIIRAIEERIHARGYTMVMQQIESSDDELALGAMMERDKRLRGIIFLGGRSDYSPENISALNVPFVCCTYGNQYGTLPRDRYSSVSIADENAAYYAIMELYRAGHHRIAALICQPDDQSISQLRYQGYRKALADCGLIADEALRICADTYDIRDAYTAVAKWLETAPDFDALFCISDMMAIGAMRALRENDRSIPGDCSVIAIDGLDITDYTSPRLTTYCQPMKQIGQHSVDILLNLLEGKGEHRQEILLTSLRKGESVKGLK